VPLHHPPPAIRNQGCSHEPVPRSLSLCSSSDNS
jgi:hypothetical protein